MPELGEIDGWLASVVLRMSGRRAQQLEWRGPLSLATLVILLIFAITANAQVLEPSVELRSGSLQLKSPAAIAADGGDSSSSKGDSTDPTPPGVDSERRKLFLIQYTEGTAWDLRDKLVLLGVSILDQVADRTLLIFGKPESIIGVAHDFGSLMAEYRAGYKRAPELSELLQLVAPARHRRNLRRALGDTSGGTLFQDVAEPAALGSLQTWGMRQHVQGQSADGPDDKPTKPRLGKVDGPNLYAVSARLVHSLPKSALRENVAAWPMALAKVLDRAATDPCFPRMSDEGLSSQLSTTIHMYFCAEDLEDGVAWLSNADQCVWAELVVKTVSNNAVAGLILQTGDLTSAQYSNPTASLRPYWNASIRGQGIIAGVGDSGIDMGHCYFIDDQYRPGSLRSYFVGNPPRLYLPYHRKVVQYMLPESTSVRGWFGDDAEGQGHGTHVAGSIAGSILNSNGEVISDAGTGSAPSARISMVDYAGAGMDWLYVPWPLDDKVLPYHYSVGARFSSESWGMGSALATSYMEYSRQFDIFAWRYPDFLSVIAGGNYGANGITSITAPGTAKNVLTVGASINHPKDTSSSLQNRFFMFQYMDTAGTLQQSALWPRMGSSVPAWKNIMDNKEVPLALANPEHACTSLLGNYTGMVVLVDMKSQSCPNNTRANNVIAKGAVGVLFINVDDLFVEENPVWDLPPTNITYAFVSRAKGLSVRSVLLSSTNTTKPIMTCLTYPRVNYGIDSLAFYSSTGPLKDGRIKPDIVAPGGPVVSASSQASSLSNPDATSDTCSKSTIAYQGTSMATPLTTGHLVLMRQYFRDGFYPTGLAGDISSVSFEPSGMLLKAAAISGAKSLAGGTATSVGKVMGNSPDGFQGWGRLDISGALPLPGLTSPNFRIQVADYGVITDGQMIYIKGIRATGTGPVNAALVWYDYPSSGSAVKDLVNDLDFGYQLNPPALASTLYNRTRLDNTNTVERVELPSLKARDNVTFIVHGRSIKHQLFTGADAKLPQRWAVVVVGHFTGVLKTQYNPAYMRPQRVLSAQTPTRMVISLPSGACASQRNGTLLVTPICNDSAAIFTFIEGKDNVTGASLYTVKDYLGNCLSVRGNSSGWRALLLPCDGAVTQRIAVFRNPHGNGLFQLVPRHVLGVSGTDRLCLRQTAFANNQTGLAIVLCNEDDGIQNLKLQEVPSTLPLPPPAPSPPPPPMPSPAQLPDKPWYPYPLLFRADFYPVEGKPNDYDYDYGSANPGFYDYYDDGSDPISNMDLVVSWKWNGTPYQVGIDTFYDPVDGVLHGGDNTIATTMFEEVHWQSGLAPNPTVYDVCVTWNTTETPTMKVMLTVFRGYAVATISKAFNTSQPAQPFVCNASSPGYVGSYNFTAPPSPPSPPSPQPPAVFYPYPVLFRTDWTPLSGFTGRENKAIDLDIVVAWTYLGESYELGFYETTTGGGSYGGDNMQNSSNYEVAYWPVGASPPPAKFDVCVRWFGAKKPLMKVSLSVYRGGLDMTATKTLDTTFPRDLLCNNTAYGYLATYDLTSMVVSPPPLASPPSPPSPPPEGCNSPLVPANMMSLIFRAQWRATQGVSTIYDWDMVVAWSFGGQAYELAQYNRFVGGGVHGGDNINMSNKTNEEVAYWPTGLTGQSPFRTTYHVCVRWYQAGNLNVTLTITLGGDVVVKRSTSSWSSTALNSKVCAPDVNGYIGSYTYANNNSSGLFANGWLDQDSATSSQGVRSEGAKEDSTEPSSVAEGAQNNVDPGVGLDPVPQGAAEGAGSGASSGGTGGKDDSAAAGSGGADTQGGNGGTDAQGGGSSGSIADNSDGSKKNVLPIVLGTTLGGIALLAMTVVAVRWRQAKLRNTRVLAT